jgi:hypothetical protein
MRRLAVLLTLVAAAAACSAASEPDDHAVNGADQQITEAPCESVAALKCQAGYHSISIARCDNPGEGRCVADACEPADELSCVTGWTPTTSHCKSPSHTKYARCAPKSAAADAGHDASAH